MVFFLLLFGARRACGGPRQRRRSERAARGRPTRDTSAMEVFFRGTTSCWNEYAGSIASIYSDSPKPTATGASSPVSAITGDFVPFLLCLTEVDGPLCACRRRIGTPQGDIWSATHGRGFGRRGEAMGSSRRRRKTENSSMGSFFFSMGTTNWQHISLGGGNACNIS